MKVLRLPWIVAVAILISGVADARGVHRGDRTVAPVAADAKRLSHGRFRNLLVYVPNGTPTSVVLFLSGDEGWNAATDAMARPLMQQGAMVVGIDWVAFKASLEADGDACVFPDGDLENLGHFVQAYFHSPTYLSPILVGVSSGASFAYAVLAQAPRNTFAAALTFGFCPSLDLQKPLCKIQRRGPDLLPVNSLGNPWLNLQGDGDRACPVAACTGIHFADSRRGVGDAAEGGARLRLAGRLDAAVHGRLRQARGAESDAHRAAARGLERSAGHRNCRATRRGRLRPRRRLDSFAIIMSGDGGWAGLDQDVAAALSAKGIPVVGLDSLRYYWTARTPDGLAADTDRMIRYYLGHFGKQRVLLIGYSQGADVLPFAVNRLPEATRARVALTAVMGMSEHALFEFHLSGWISDDNSGPATLPEINRITGMPVLCIYGADESDSLCPKLDPKKFDVVKLKGGHHFDGDYAGLARQILAAAHP